MDNQNKECSIGIKSIVRKCISDHTDYIISNIHNNQIHEISDNYKKGIVRYSEIKDLMNDITIHHPQLMSFMLNPQDSQLCNEDICKNIQLDKILYENKNNIHQQGGNNDIRINNNVIKTFECINTIFDLFKTSDPITMKKEKNELVDTLCNIDSQLTIMVDVNKNNADNVLNNINIIIDSMDKFNPMSHSYKNFSELNNLKIPIGNVGNIKKSDAIKNMIFYYLDLIKTPNIMKNVINKLIYAQNISHLKNDLIIMHQNTSFPQNISNSNLIPKIIQTLNKSTQTNMINTKIDILNNIISDKLLLDRNKIQKITDTEYDNIENHINTKILNLDKLTTQLELHTNQIGEYLYDKSPRSIRMYRPICSNILPKIKDIINLFRMYIQSLSDSDPTYPIIKMIIDNYDTIKTDNFEDINKFLNIYNSLLNNYDNYYVVDKLNIFLAEMYRVTLNKLLIFKVVENIPTKTLIYSHEIDKIKLNSEKTLIDLLSQEIKTEKSARIFIHTYNTIFYDIDPNILMNIGVPQSINIIPHVYFSGKYTEHVNNNIFGNINDYNKSKINMLNNLINDSIDVDRLLTQGQDVNIGYKIIDTQKINNVNVLIQRIIMLSILEIRYMCAIKKYNKQQNKYNIAYNDIYMYTMYLILIATNQSPIKNNIIYKYLNKDIINFYKNITSKMIQDIDSHPTEPHISYIRKYYNVIIRYINCFLNKISTLMLDSDNIIDVKNIDSTSPIISSDILTLNYFIPIIEFYNREYGKNNSK
jgi:hypothetical protein